MIDGAAQVFGDRLPRAQRYHDLLADEGVAHGLIGPREVPRLWERHLLNSAAIAELIGDGARVIDVGSGAGLPGIPLAIARPDLRVDLVEPMQRRVAFLRRAVDDLGLGPSVRVVRGRAPDVLVELEPAGTVVARALAPLERLAAWCLPLVQPGGRLIAMKGDRAATELAAIRPYLGNLGIDEAVVHRVGGEHATTAIVLRKSAHSRTGGRRAWQTQFHVKH